MRLVYGVPINQSPLPIILHRMAACIRHDGQPMTVCLVNTLSLVEANRNVIHLQALRDADLCLADGWPVAALAHTPRIAGADLMLAAARDPALSQVRHTLYGGFGVAYRAAVAQWNAAGKPPNVFGPWLPEHFSEHQCVQKINRTRPDILWVALGCPKQELWMAEHRDELTAKVVIGVGAAFNFLAGKVKRAPEWMQRWGLEGIFRVWAEPSRWRRQVGAGVGLARLLLTRRPSC